MYFEHIAFRFIWYCYFFQLGCHQVLLYNHFIMQQPWTDQWASRCKVIIQNWIQHIYDRIDHLADSLIWLSHDWLKVSRIELVSCDLLGSLNEPVVRQRTNRHWEQPEWWLNPIQIYHNINAIGRTVAEKSLYTTYTGSTSLVTVFTWNNRIPRASGWWRFLVWLTSVLRLGSESYKA